MTNLAGKRRTFPALSHESGPETFTKFPDLPSELRREIWKYLLPGPRVIIIAGPPRTSYRRIEGRCFVDGIKTPELLHICQESRDFALERYRLSFGPHLSSPVYFDFSSDVLLLDNEKVLSMFFERSNGSITSEVTMVKTIAIDLPFLEESGRMHIVNNLLFLMSVSDRLLKATARFGNLREIVLLKSPDSLPQFSQLLDGAFKAKMRLNYSEFQDEYTLKRREFLKDEDGSIPKITFMTIVDFWNRFH
jgi:hypothetical protein